MDFLPNWPIKMSIHTAVHLSTFKLLHTLIYRYNFLNLYTQFNNHTNYIKIIMLSEMNIKMFA